MKGQLYRIHGLTVRSDLELEKPLAADSGSTVDVELFSEGTRSIPSEAPEGRLIADAADEDGSLSASMAMAGSTPTVRFHRRCEFVFSPDLTRVGWACQPDVPREEVAACANAVFSLIVVLRGDLALHASAVSVGGRALAIAAHSEGGKSTLATLLCLAGASLVSDDLLRVSSGTCFVAEQETRLRFGANDEIVASVDRRHRCTYDGRIAVEQARCMEDSLPLGAVLVPRVDDTVREVVAETLRPAAAALQLSRFLRVRGWRDPSYLAQQLPLVVEVAQTVPVVRCRIPVGPPFPRELAPRLLAAVGMT